MRNYSYPLPIILSLLVLTGFSLTTLNSISTSVFLDQLFFITFGAILFLIISRLDYHFFTAFPWAWYLIGNLLLLATFIFGKTTKGSTRWIDIGPLQFQPSEFVKPLIIVFLAGYIAKRHPNTLKQFLLLASLIIIPIILIYRQPDLGSSLLVASLSAGIIISSGTSIRYIAALFLPLLFLTPTIWNLLKEYQQQRILSFLNPASDPLGSGYNAIQAMIAVGSGMIFGRGLGRGTQSQLRFLPERQTDFIFASIAEEFGFIGSVALILSYAWLLYSILKIASRSKDITGRLISIGSFVLILTQVFINIGMNLGLLPITGITLPLVSAGGSSVIVTFVILGLVASVARFQAHPKPTLEIR